MRVSGSRFPITTRGEDLEQQALQFCLCNLQFMTGGRFIHPGILAEKGRLFSWDSSHGVETIHSGIAAQTTQMQMDEKTKSARTKLAQEITSTSSLTAELANSYRLRFLSMQAVILLLYSVCFASWRSNCPTSERLPRPKIICACLERKSARTKLAQEITSTSSLTAELANALIDRVYVHPGNQVERLPRPKIICACLERISSNRLSNSASAISNS